MAKAVSLSSRIPLIIAELTPRMVEGMRESADAIAAGAKERVPTRTGNLRDSIHVESEGDSVSVVAGDSDTYYGHLVEFGTVKAGAQPFLMPAYETERQRIEEIIGEKLEDL